MYSLQRAMKCMLSCKKNDFKSIAISKLTTKGYFHTPQILLSKTNLFSSQSCERLNYFDMASSPLIREDLKNLHADAQEILRQNIKSDELYNITAYNFANCTYEARPWNILSILVAKAVNFHLSNTGTLSDVQRKMVAISDIVAGAPQFSDDIIDNDRMRERHFAAAFVNWNRIKVILATKAALATALDEAAKVNGEVLKTLFHVSETLYRSQCIFFEPNVPDGDFFAQYLTNIYSKSAVVYENYFKVLSELNTRNKIMLTEAVGKFGINFGMYFQLQDDIDDFESDVERGLITAPVIFASKEHPSLEKLMLRKFSGKGDMETVIELVKNSNGTQETKMLGGRYLTEARRCLSMLAPSPYRAALEAVLRYCMECELGLEAKDKMYEFVDTDKV